MSGYDETRDFFPGCSPIVEAPKFEPMVGPLTPAPNATMTDFVATIIFGRAA